MAALERLWRVVDVDIGCDFPFVALINAEKSVAVWMAGCDFEELRLSLRSNTGPPSFDSVAATFEVAKDAKTARLSMRRGGIVLSLHKSQR